MIARACRRHRPVLLDLVDRGERGPATAAALDHLAVCPACEEELTGLALTIAALRRAGTTYRALPVPEAPGPARRAVTGAVAATATRRGPWAWRLQLGSLAASAAIVALIVAPRVGTGPPDVPTRAPASQLSAVSIAWHVTEARIAAGPDTPSYAAAVNLPIRYPDGLPRTWKEVFSTDASQRELKPS